MSGRSGKSAAALGVVVCVLAGSAAHGQSLVLDPTLPSELSAPGYFDGLYAGLLFGAAGNAHGNFYPSGGAARGEIGGFVGWNTYLTPDVILGGEVMIAGQTDFAGTYSLAAIALGQLGLLVEDDIAFYVLGGGGVFGSAPAFAFGVRAEAAVYDNVSVRAEMINFVQAGASSGGVFVPGVTAQMLNLGVVWHFAEEATGGWRLALDAPMSLPDFDGFYAGGSVGLHYNATYNFFPNVGFGLHPARLDMGAFLGWNSRLNDFLVAGVEGQASLLFDTSGDVGGAGWALGRLGVVPWDGALVYAQGGLGIVQNRPAFGLGGGIEVAAFDDASARLEGLAYGELGGAGGLTAGKVSAGVVWHLD